MRPKLLFLLFFVYCGTVFGQAPRISSVKPTYAEPGTTVIITGQFFNSAAANNVVMLGGAKARITSASATSIKITVPPGGVYQPVSVLNTANGLTGYFQNPFMVAAESIDGFSAKDLDQNLDLNPGYGPSVIRMADIDDDGKLDMAVLKTSEFDKSVSFYRNKSSKGVINAASFAPKFDKITGDAKAADMILQDLDGDGKPELIILNSQVNSIDIYIITMPYLVLLTPPLLARKYH